MKARECNLLSPGRCRDLAWSPEAAPSYRARRPAASRGRTRRASLRQAWLSSSRLRPLDECWPQVPGCPRWPCGGGPRGPSRPNCRVVNIKSRSPTTPPGRCYRLRSRGLAFKQPNRNQHAWENGSFRCAQRQLTPNPLKRPTSRGQHEFKENKNGEQEQGLTCSSTPCSGPGIPRDSSCPPEPGVAPPRSWHHTRSRGGSKGPSRPW